MAAPPLLYSENGVKNETYYVTINLRDYVFVWSGRSVVYCGE